jgi:hypothetical protein
MDQSQDDSMTEARDVTTQAVLKADKAKLKLATEAALQPEETNTKTTERSKTAKKGSRAKCAKKHHKKANKGKKQAKADEESSDDDSDEAEDSSVSADSDSESSESESEDDKKKRSSKKRQEEVKARQKKAAKKMKKPVLTSDADSATSDSSESVASESDSNDNSKGSSGRKQQAQQQALLMQLQQLQMNQMNNQLQYPNNMAYQYPSNPMFQYPTGSAYPFPSNPGLAAGLPPAGGNLRMPPPTLGLPGGIPGGTRAGIPPRRGLGKLPPGLAALDGKKPPATKRDKKRVKSSKLDYKRVDQVWDNTLHNYKLQDTAESTTDAQYEEYLFHVRRTFDWEGKYKTTMVDIKSKSLRECLQEVIGNIKGLSLVEDTPKMDPNMLFLYLDDLRAYYKGLKKAKPKGEDKQARKKDKKKIETKQQHLKVLLKYIDKDYAKVKESLYPMLKNGLITFDLLWALWKPNTLAFTTTYGSHDQPRVFKVEMAEQHYSIMKGNSYYIEGKYFEYDGKQHGYGNMAEELGEFRGARKITSLRCFPLEYHRNEAKLREELIERGKKFVALSGVHYKSHQGMAYYKKKKSIIKVNINGRIMVDPSIHRRINPNYPISLVRPKDHDLLDDDDSDDDSACGCASESDDEEAGGEEVELEDAEDKPKFVNKLIKDDRGKLRIIRMPKEEADEMDKKEKLDQVQSKDEKEGTLPDQQAHSDESVTQTGDKAVVKIPEFTDEEYLIASPVVLGFAFAEKLWLEFTVSGVKEIQWNEHAYESLVLEPKTKDIVKVRSAFSACTLDLTFLSHGMLMTSFLATGFGGVAQVSRRREHRRCDPGQGQGSCW